MRQVHPSVLAQLREIDPDADAFYMGVGLWIVGARQPMTSIREQSFRHGLGLELSEDESMKREAKIELLRYRLRTGFTVAMDPVHIRQDTEWAEAIFDFKRRTWLMMNDPEGAAEDALNHSDFDADLQIRKAEMEDYADSEMDFLEAFGIRGVRRFVMPGLN